jgi:hypothetical protein
MNMEGKICNICRETKTIESFSINKNTKDGRSYKCKSCQNEYNRKTTALYRERKRNKEREWRQRKAKEDAIVSHIGFKSFDFARDHSNTLKFLRNMGYDMNKDIHEQFLQRVLIAFGKVLPPKDKPKDRISKYYE